jgi:integrase
VTEFVSISDRASAARRPGWAPRLHLHTVRHSTASFLLAAGTHIKIVQEHLGPSSCAITAGIYSRVGSALQREAADRLDATLER